MRVVWDFRTILILIKLRFSSFSPLAKIIKANGNRSCKRIKSFCRFFLPFQHAYLERFSCSELRDAFETSSIHKSRSKKSKSSRQKQI